MADGRSRIYGTLENLPRTPTFPSPLACFLRYLRRVRLETGARVFGLDVMRATAILLVLLSHAAIWFAS